MERETYPKTFEGTWLMWVQLHEWARLGLRPGLTTDEEGNWVLFY